MRLLIGVSALGVVGQRRQRVEAPRFCGGGGIYRKGHREGLMPMAARGQEGALVKKQTCPPPDLLGVAGPDARGRLRRNISTGSGPPTANVRGLVPLCPRSGPHHRTISGDEGRMEDWGESEAGPERKKERHLPREIPRPPCDLPTRRGPSQHLRHSLLSPAPGSARPPRVPSPWREPPRHPTTNGRPTSAGLLRAPTIGPVALLQVLRAEGGAPHVVCVGRDTPSSALMAG